jgi:signal transduction histidine kinase
LGLAIVRRTASLEGGRFEFRKEASGATATLRFPAQ